MRRTYILAAIAAMFAGTVAAAADWWYTGGSGDLAVFVDTATIARTDRTTSIWEYVIFREPLQGVKSSKRQKIVDCKTLAARLVQVIDYDEAEIAGVPLNYTRAPRGYELAPDAIVASAYRFACNPDAARPPTGALAARAPFETADLLFRTVAMAGN